MKIKKLLVEIDKKTGFYFSTYTGEDGTEKYDMRLYTIRSRTSLRDTRYTIEEPPADLINPIVAYIDGLIKEG